MQKWFKSAVLACGCALVLTGVLSAQNAQPAQPAEVKVQVQIAEARAIRADIAIPVMPRTQLLQSDAAFVGRVVGFEPMDVEAVQVPGQAMVKYRVAVVQITEALHGVKKETKQVRVGFVVQANNVPGGPGGVQILPAPADQPQILPVQPPPPFRGRPFPGVQQIQLTVGQEGLFNLNKHPKESFYLSPNFQQFVAKQGNPGFDAQLKTAKQLAKVMGNPVAALKAEDKEDRYAAAAVLISKYRNPANPQGKPLKEVKVDAAESKLILQAIAGGEWKVGVFNAAIPAPFELFNQLGIQPKDGYTPNFRDQQTMFQGMQKWLDENQGKYVIVKLEVDPNAKAPQPGVIQPGIDPKPGVIRPGIQPLPPIRIQPDVQPLPAVVPPVQDLPALPARQEK